jgi:L-lactate dehydrogenase complex protein LldG
MSASRDRIFADIKAALAPLPQRVHRPEVPHGVADARWLHGEETTSELFLKRARTAGTVCFVSAEECVSWLTSRQIKKLYIPAALTEMVAFFSKAVDVTTTYRRDQVNEIDASLTPAAGAIAESGTIILTDASSPDRLAELAPWTHIAIVRKESIHRSIADAIGCMPDDPNIIWVTGPSKTADVEGILIQGVHGPGIQGCLLVE